VLVADPPWQFGDKLPGPGRGAEKHYACMPAYEIGGFELPPIADDALLFLWRVAAMQNEALAVAEHWGFTIKAELIWRKVGANGAPRIGMGRYVRNAHETCLIGARGKAAKLIQHHGVPSVFDAPRGQHSAKPDAFYDIVEKLAPGPYVELFARRQRAGWTCLGNEV
ncbi:MAG TPA: MT-A70 family methyltransferase, partial [Terriglobales bacterium]|nr:MT-A70 family methyltransferase [Terriglobales bacterium]